MQSVSRRGKQNTMDYFVLSVLCALLVGKVLITIRQRKERAKMFPAISDKQIVYEELFASGYSQVSPLLFLFSEARGGIHLILTANELLVRPNFFQAFGIACSMDHYILKKYIVSLKKHQEFMRGEGVLIEYRREDGKISSIFIVPQDFNAFWRALNAEPIAAR